MGVQRVVRAGTGEPAGGGESAPGGAGLRQEGLPQEGLRLEQLGGLRLTHDGAPLTGFTYAKSQALLAYFAVTARPHTRDALATLLWGEWPDDAARRNLRGLLLDLRRHAGGALVIARDAVSFDRAAPYWLDVEAFEAALRRPEAGDVPLNPQRLRVAVDTGKLSVRAAMESLDRQLLPFLAQ